MAIPNTPLVENLVTQIDRDIKGFLKSENYEYLLATPENLAMLNQKLAEHFHSTGIQASYSTPRYYGDAVKLNINISDGYVLSRLKEVNDSEYSRVATWMAINGQDIPKLECLTPSSESEERIIASTSGIQTFTGSEQEKKEAIASKILAAEQERRRWQALLTEPSTRNIAKKVEEDGVVSIGFDAAPKSPIPSTSAEGNATDTDWLKVY